MSLELTKLKDLRDSGDKQIAQCPACAAHGGDSKGEHLVIFPDGKYGCVAQPDDKLHQKEIFRLVGASTPEASNGPIPVRVRRPDCVTRTPKVILVLKSLAAPEPATGAVTDLQAQPPTPGKEVAEPQNQGGAPMELPYDELRQDRVVVDTTLPAPNNRGIMAKSRQAPLDVFWLMREVKEGPDLQSRTRAAKSLMAIFAQTDWPPDEEWYPDDDWPPDDDY